MNELFVDLHVHTIYSDGSFTPEQVIEYAHKKKIVAISITDHDTTEGILPAIKEGTKLGIEVIPGIELSVESEYSLEQEIHILGYFINWEDEELQKKLAVLQKARLQRAYKIIQKLDSLDIHINKDELFQIAGKGVIGRLHFARLMLDMGCVRSISEAFSRFLSYGKPAYEPKLRLTPQEAIQLIDRTGGISALAHPYYSDYDNPNLVSELVDMGLKGIEVWHSKQSHTVTDHLTRIAYKFKLLTVGGSDCHGPIGSRTPTIGAQKVPYRIVTELKKYKLKTYEKRANTSIHW